MKVKHHFANNFLKNSLKFNPYFTYYIYKYSCIYYYL